MERYHVPGLSIALIHDRQIHMAKGFGVLEAGTDHKVDSDTIFNACSISKFVTAMLVMKLVDQGFLDLDEDINNILTSWKLPYSKLIQSNKVTLRTLLSHQSGVVDPEGSFGEFDPTQGIPTMVDLLEGRTPYCKESIKVMYKPGSDFQYSDIGFCIIQQAIEDVLGQSFEEIMNELVFEPLNMKSSLIMRSADVKFSQKISCGHQSNGDLVSSKYPFYPYPAAVGVWTSPSDLARLVIELMYSLHGTSQLGISPRTSKEMITSQGGKVWAGLGLFLDSSNHEVEISSLGWGVGYQCMMIAYPYLRSGAVIMTNTDLGVHQMKGIIGEIVNSLEW
ncbi:class A beta-lactamase-related serine hydrolase [Paenibacillus albiflavus]|uniref:Class A beta-lactamase-related serine hydrolase n=1 Tax=Paenibacillus albiflavus TaxID=2545760 RepID=A0A4R4DWM3_9BACL|nr:class A beta-lactamase-related serine hydrolase [Paenibacillus albiflavus]